MITVDYSNNTMDCGGARTLDPTELGYNEHSGWSIEGDIYEDHKTWVKEFVATHSDLGTIKGSFEDKVTTESHEALDHFLRYHPYKVWDYRDI